LPLWQLLIFDFIPVSNIIVSHIFAEVMKYVQRQ